MIKHFRVQNYKALKDVSLEFTPIHVLIGPNDSGKTSILEALGALCRSVDSPLSEAFMGTWTGRELVNHRSGGDEISFRTAGNGWSYSLDCRFGLSGRDVGVFSEDAEYSGDSVALTSGGSKKTTVCSVMLGLRGCNDGERRAIRKIHEELGGVQYCRWVPGLLSLPVALGGSKRFRMDSSGFGLALCLDDILGFDRERFAALENRLCVCFPQIKSISLVRERAYGFDDKHPEGVPSETRSEGKGIHFKFVDGTTVSAAQVSDGVMLILAYLAMLYLPEPPRVLLIEEPENGIHPARLRDVLGILRDLIAGQKHTQVLLTTHSPYVVDMFEPEEVTLTRMQEDGSVAVQRLSDSDVVRRQADVFTLGEIWTAEGDEALSQPLVSTPA